MSRDRLPLRADFLAQAAAHTKETYLSALYGRLAARRGKQRALMAVAHSMMVSVFHMLACQEPYRELGARYFDERWRHYTVDRLAQRIERLGYRSHLEPVATTASVRNSQGNRTHHSRIIRGSFADHSASFPFPLLLSPSTCVGMEDALSGLLTVSVPRRASLSGSWVAVPGNAGCADAGEACLRR